MTSGWRLVALALTLASCATSTRPAHDVALTEVTARASAAPAPLPAPSYRVPVNDSPVVIEQAETLLHECPRFFSLDPEAECASSFEPWCYDPLESTDPLPMSERIERAHTALRLTSSPSPEMAAVGRFLLASYTPMIRAADVSDPESLCANPGVARGLFEMLERLDGLTEQTSSDRNTWQKLAELGVCGDIESLGLLGRWQAMARRQITRDAAAPDEDNFWSSTWVVALSQRATSVARRRIFLEGFEASPPLRRAMLAGSRHRLLGQTPDDTVDAEFCAVAERHIMSDEQHDSDWTTEVFLAGECSSRRDLFLTKLRARLADRATLTVGPLKALERICYFEGVAEIDMRQAFDLLKPLAGTQTTDDALRTQALRGACQCSSPRARSLAAQGRQSRSASVREVANSDSCRR